MTLLKKFWLHILISSILIGVACSLFFYFTFQPGLIRPDVRMFDFWIPTVATFFMLIYFRSFREKTSPFHFWEGLIVGNLMFWLGGITSGFSIYLMADWQPIPFEHFRDSCIKYIEVNMKEAPELQKMEKPELLIRDFREMKPSVMIWEEAKLKFKYSIILVPLISVFLRRK
jgi:hypothetical protein